MSTATTQNSTNQTVNKLATRLNKVHVLLVDGNIDFLHMMRHLLNRLGFGRISTATDGSEAIAILKDRNLLRDNEVDLIITDWDMQPLSGIDLIKFVRTSPDSPNPYLPIIMVSGRDEWRDVELARDAGFSEYLIKPFTIKALCDRILLCVENPRAFVSTSNYKGPSRRRREAPQLPPGVTQDRRQRNSENTLPGKALKRKIGFDISLRQVFTREHLENVQQFIDSHHDQYRQLALRDITHLKHTLRNMQQVGNPAQYINKVRRLALSLKAHAGMFGYQLGTLVAKSLVAICEKPGADPAKDILIIEKHIDTLHVIFMNNVRGMGDAVGVELMSGLNALIKKCRTPAAPTQQTMQGTERHENSPSGSA